MNEFKCGNCGAIRYEVDNVVAVKCMECDSSECYGPLNAQKAPVAEVPCSDGLCTLRPNGEPHPAMISIYAYADEIEDKEPERSDSICSLAMQLEEKLWKMAVGA